LQSLIQFRRLPLQTGKYQVAAQPEGAQQELHPCSAETWTETVYELKGRGRNEISLQGAITKKNLAFCCIYYFPRPSEITVSK